MRRFLVSLRDVSLDQLQTSNRKDVHDVIFRLNFDGKVVDSRPSSTTVGNLEWNNEPKMQFEYRVRSDTNLSQRVAEVGVILQDRTRRMDELLIGICRTDLHTVATGPIKHAHHLRHPALTNEGAAPVAASGGSVLTYNLYCEECSDIQVELANVEADLPLMAPNGTKPSPQLVYWVEGKEDKASRSVVLTSTATPQWRKVDALVVPGTLRKMLASTILLRFRDNDSNVVIGDVELSTADVFSAANPAGGNGGSGGNIEAATISRNGEMSANFVACLYNVKPTRSARGLLTLRNLPAYAQMEDGTNVDGTTSGRSILRGLPVPVKHGNPNLAPLDRAKVGEETAFMKNSAAFTPQKDHVMQESAAIRYSPELGPSRARTSDAEVASPTATQSYLTRKRVADGVEPLSMRDLMSSRGSSSPGNSRPTTGDHYHYQPAYGTTGSAAHRPGMSAGGISALSASPYRTDPVALGSSRPQRLADDLLTRQTIALEELCAKEREVEERLLREKQRHAEEIERQLEEIARQDAVVQEHEHTRRLLDTQIKELEDENSERDALLGSIRAKYSEDRRSIQVEMQEVDELHIQLADMIGAVRKQMDEERERKRLLVLREAQIQRQLQEDEQALELWRQRWKLPHQSRSMSPAKQPSVAASLAAPVSPASRTVELPTQRAQSPVGRPLSGRDTSMAASTASILADAREAVQRSRRTDSSTLDVDAQSRANVSKVASPTRPVRPGFEASTLHHADIEANIERDMSVAVRANDVARLRQLVMVCQREGLKIRCGDHLMLTACAMPAPHPEIVELLCKVCDAACIDTATGNTPLHYACAAAEPSIDVLDALFRFGARCDGYNMEGLTPYHVALLNTNDHKRNHELKQFLVGKARVNVNQMTAAQESPAHICCFNHRHLPTVKWLAYAGADMKKECTVYDSENNPRKMTAKDKASMYGAAARPIFDFLTTL